MVNYRESYEIEGRSYGIEDYKQPGEHFMPDDQEQRFMAWHIG